MVHRLKFFQMSFDTKFLVTAMMVMDQVLRGSPIGGKSRVTIHVPRQEAEAIFCLEGNQEHPPS